MTGERPTILFEGDFEYPGAIGILSRCWLKVIQGPNGTLVQAAQRYQLDPARCIFVEHYAPGVLSYPLDRDGTGTYKVVEFEWSGKTARNPTWKPSTELEVAAFLAML